MTRRKSYRDPNLSEAVRILNKLEKQAEQLRALEELNTRTKKDTLPIIKFSNLPRNQQKAVPPEKKLLEFGPQKPTMPPPQKQPKIEEEPKQLMVQTPKNPLAGASPSNEHTKELVKKHSYLKQYLDPENSGNPDDKKKQMGN